MMVEDYCSFETALALKEKGFDAEIKTYWCKGTHDEPIFEFIPNARNHDISNSEGYMHFNGHQSDLEDEPVCIAPTLQMAMKWLREEKNIFIDICTLSPMAYTFRTAMISDTTGYLYEDYACEEGERYMNYNEAVEAALSYVLENILSEE